MNVVELEEGEIPDSTLQLAAGSMAAAELESWSKRWKMAKSSKTGGMYFSNIENSEISIWLNDVAKLHNWQKHSSTSGGQQLHFYENSLIKRSVWEDDFLIMKSYCDILSTPCSEPQSVQRSVFSPDFQEEHAKTEDQQAARKVKKAAKKFAEMLAKAPTGIKIGSKSLQGWIKTWFDQPPDEKQQNAFCSFFATKLAEELLRKKGQKLAKSHQKALKLLVGKKLTNQLGKDSTAPSDFESIRLQVTGKLAEYLVSSKMEAKIGRFWQEKRQQPNPST